MSDTDKLKLLLAAIKVKQDTGVPLTANELNLVAECHRIYHAKPQESMTIDASGMITIKRSVDAEPIMQTMKDYADIFGKNHGGRSGTRMLGSIDPITASIWRKECGAGIGTKEFAVYAKKKLADPDFKRFRFGGM